MPFKSHSLSGTPFPFVVCFIVWDYTKSARPLTSSSTAFAIELDSGE